MSLPGLSSLHNHHQSRSRSSSTLMRGVMWIHRDRVFSRWVPQVSCHQLIERRTSGEIMLTSSCFQFKISLKSKVQIQIHSEWSSSGSTHCFGSLVNGKWHSAWHKWRAVLDLYFAYYIWTIFSTCFDFCQSQNVNCEGRIRREAVVAKYLGC